MSQSIWFRIPCFLIMTTTPLSLNGSERWSADRAHAWYAKLPWLVGCNFTPSTAINQLEMWQADTFDPETIDRELGWAADIRMNTVRVYLHDLVWKEDAKGLKERIDQFLSIADSHGIRMMPVIFDAVWDPNPKSGKQREPKPGVHNSGWMQSPAADVLKDPSQWDYLEAYVKDVISTFSNDPRVLIWDLYNEPGNSGHGTVSLPLLEKVFSWAREVDPSQPLTAGIWNYDLNELNEYQLAHSDVISFHNYLSPKSLEEEVGQLEKHGRPLICTEYMARTRDSWFETSLLIFKEHNIGAYNWGLVMGKIQTHYPWKSPEGASEPALWFHDIFRPDGTPFCQREVDFIRLITDR